MDDDLHRKVWTCLEYVIIHHTELLKDRHLDQMIMCAVYVIAKVSIKVIFKQFHIFMLNKTMSV